MTYSISKLIELLGESFSLMLNAVLSRLPIVIVGKDTELLDDLTDSISQLCSHRHILVFWRDFTTEDELLSVWAEEKHDYDVVRTTICSFSSSINLAMERINQFMGWIIATPFAKSYDSNCSPAPKSIISSILETSPNCGVLNVSSPSLITFSLAKDDHIIFDVEKRIISKILSRKKTSLERIRRLLKKSLRNMKYSDHIVSVILNLDDESEKITRDMFNEEINGFVHAARRATTLLSRIRLAREFGATTTLTERNLFEVIGWDGGTLHELIRFIKSEWHEDFSDCVKGGTLSGLGAWVDSMWGT